MFWDAERLEKLPSCDTCELKRVLQCSSQGRMKIYKDEVEFLTLWGNLRKPNTNALAGEIRTLLFSCPKEMLLSMEANHVPKYPNQINCHPRYSRNGQKTYCNETQPLSPPGSLTAVTAMFFLISVGEQSLKIGIRHQALKLELLYILKIVTLRKD